PAGGSLPHPCSSRIGPMAMTDYGGSCPASLLMKLATLPLATPCRTTPFTLVYVMPAVWLATRQTTLPKAKLRCSLGPDLKPAVSLGGAITAIPPLILPMG